MTAKMFSSTAIAAMMLLGLNTMAQAAPGDFDTLFVDDSYIGGNAPSAYVGQDVVGGSAFNTLQSRIIRQDDNLEVVIKTNYADTVYPYTDNNGTIQGELNEGALETRVGSLFIGVSDSAPTFNDGNDPTTPGAGDTVNDVFQLPDGTGGNIAGTGDPGRFDYVVTPTTQYTKDGEFIDAQLNSLNGTGSDVQLSYYKTPDQNTGNSFREGQAVGYSGNQDALDNVATWSLDKNDNDPGTITFRVADFFVLEDFSPGTYLTVVWAMTCANDVISHTFVIPEDSITIVPLPAGALLLLSGLFGLGFLGRYRSKLQDTSV